MKNIFQHYFLKSNSFPLLFLLIVTVFSIFYQGYYYGHIDQSQFIPYIQKVQDPSLYPKDIFINAIYAQNPIKMWQVLAIVYSQVDFPALIFALHFIFRFLFFISIFYLSYEIFKKREISYLATLFWVTSKPSFGYEILYNNFVHSQVAIPLCLFSILLILKKKYLLSAIFLIASFYAHPPKAIFTSATIFAILFFEKQFSLIFKYFAGVLVGVIPVLKDATGVVGVGNFDAKWVETIRVRLSHQSFPLSWKISSIASQLSFSVLLIFSYILFWKRLSFKQTKVLLIVIVTSIVMMVVLGIVLSDLIPIPKIIALHTFHASFLFTIFGSFVITYGIYNLVTSKKNLSQVLGYFLAYIFFFNQYTLNFQKSFLIMLVPFVLLVIWFRIKPSLLFVLLVAVLIMWLPYATYKNQLVTNAKYQDWKAVQYWAQKNTSKNTTFIVPIYEEGFRVYSKRPIIGEWKDGDWGYVSPKFVEEWWLRMKEFGLTEKKHEDVDQIEEYKKLDSQKIKQIANKYNAGYIVVPKDKLLKTQLVYEGEYYKVYETN